MRKTLAVVISLILALAAVGALAEAAAGTNNTTYNFGDFNLMYPEDDKLDLGEKTEGGVYFTLFSTATSEANFTNNLNCIWSSAYNDIKQVKPQDLLDYTVNAFSDQAATQGLIATNVQGIQADLLQLGGLDAVVLAYSYDADYSKLGYDLQASLTCLSACVSDPDFGTYTFSITSGNEAGVTELTAVLDSITWNR